MVFSGVSPDDRLVEIAELKDHPFMLGTQFHPEFKSRPYRAHPLFAAFLEAVVKNSRR
jgi:CTP synthase